MTLHRTYLSIASKILKPNTNGWPIQWSKLLSLPQSIITRDANKANTEKDFKPFFEILKPIKPFSNNVRDASFGIILYCIMTPISQKRSISVIVNTAYFTRLINHKNILPFTQKISKMYQNLFWRYNPHMIVNDKGN